ncbi:MAG: energy-coupling factor transporter transmembrane component T [Clostridia bacterium]
MSTEVVADSSLKISRKIEYKKTIFGYTPKWTVFSRIHPLARLSLILIFNLPFFIVNPFINGVFFIAVLLMYRIAHIPFEYVKKFLPFGFTLTFFLFLTYAFFPSIFLKPPYKIELFSIGFYTYYYENFVVSFLMWIRWMSAIFGALFVFAVTDESDINIALKTVKVPFFLRLTIATGLRSFFSFYYDAKQIIEAQKARGLDLENMNIVMRLRYYVAVMVPLIMIELQRADEMSDAADSRGFVAFGKKADAITRTEYIGRNTLMQAGDKVLVFMAIFLIVFVVAVQLIPAAKALIGWVPVNPAAWFSWLG